MATVAHQLRLLGGLVGLVAFDAVDGAEVRLVRVGLEVLRLFGEGVVALVALEALALRGPAGFGGKLAAVDFGEGLFSSAGAEGKAQTEGGDKRHGDGFGHDSILRKLVLLGLCAGGDFVAGDAAEDHGPAQVAAAGTAETPAVEDAGELQRKWAEVVERVKARQASYAGLLLNARATADDGSRLTVSFPAGSTFAIKMLGRADTQSVVLPTVSAVFGRRTVDYVLDGGGTPAPQHEEHSPSVRAAASADPQPVSSAAPASSSASATQPKAAPIAAPTPSAPKPAASKPAAPTPAPKPASPAPKSSDLGKAPWLRSDNPAGAPATGKLPTEPAPRAPERASAPKAQPAAPSAPWESEQVPYDDAMVGGFVADAGGDDLPPFDVPGAASAPKSAATAPKEEDAPAAPWESNPGAGSPFGHQGAAPNIPQTEDEAKALIRSVFGQATIFKPVE